MPLPSSFRAWRDRWAWYRREAIDWWDRLTPNRRGAISLGLIAVAVAMPVAMVRLARTDAGWASGGGRRQVTLYTSLDDGMWRPVIAAFEADKGIIVNVVGDTEATKAVAVMTRLAGEKDAPKADVWWSSEPSTTIELKRQGLLSIYSSRAELTMPAGWPTHLRCGDGTWYAHALRSRVIAFDTRKFSKANAPNTLRALADPKLRRRIGMARPQFGSTRMHMATIVAACGEPAVKQWLEAMSANEVRLYDGNSTIVRAIANGEIDVGLTDTDDVWAAQRQQWPVDFVFEKADPLGTKVAGLPAIGPVLLPATVARVRHGPNPIEAETLIEFLLSVRVERMLAEGPGHQTPIRPEVLRDFPQFSLPKGADVSFDQIADAVPAAMRLVSEVLGSR